METHFVKTGQGPFGVYSPTGKPHAGEIRIDYATSGIPDHRAWKWLAIFLGAWAISATFAAIIFAGVIHDRDRLWFDTAWQRMFSGTPDYIR